jgi:hypothetical protein
LAAHSSQQAASPAPECASGPLHAVQFYDPASFPAQSIADYFCSGLRSGDTSLMIATRDHAHQIKDAIALSGLRVEELERTGRLVCLDAPSILATLRSDGPIHEKRVSAIFQPRLLRCVDSSASGRVRVFGEMVDLVASDGDYASCAALEHLWNAFLAKAPFQLYCTYSTHHFANHFSAEALGDIFDSHDQVVPVSPGLRSGDWLWLLLRQACSLQAEIKTRKALEQTLRSLEASYADLFSAQTVGRMDNSASADAAGSALRSNSKEFEQLAGKALREILRYCHQASEARQSVPEESPEWHKRTGEILAFGKLTKVLNELEKLTGSKRSN